MRLFYIKMFIIIPKATSKKIIQKYSKRNRVREFKWYTRTYLTQKKAVMEK